MCSQELLRFVKMKTRRRNVGWGGGAILHSNSDSGGAAQTQRGGGSEEFHPIETSSSNFVNQGPSRPPSTGVGGDAGSTTSREPGESTMLESIPKLNIVILTGRVSADPQVGSCYPLYTPTCTRSIIPAILISKNVWFFLTVNSAVSLTMEIVWPT